MQKKLGLFVVVVVFCFLRFLFCSIRWSLHACFAIYRTLSHLIYMQFVCSHSSTSVRSFPSLCALDVPYEHLRILSLCSLCLFFSHSSLGYLLRWYWPVYPWRGVALPAALLQLRLRLPREGGPETAETHRLSWHPTEEVGKRAEKEKRFTGSFEQLCHKIEN